VDTNHRRLSPLADDIAMYLDADQPKASQERLATSSFGTRTQETLAGKGATGPPAQFGSRCFISDNTHRRQTDG